MLIRRTVPRALPCGLQHAARDRSTHVLLLVPLSACTPTDAGAYLGPRALGWQRRLHLRRTPGRPGAIGLLSATVAASSRSLGRAPSLQDPPDPASPSGLPASELNCPGPGRRRRRLGRPQAASGRSLPSISIAWQIHADATPSLSAVVETPIRRRQTPLAGPRAPLLPAASLNCTGRRQLGVWKPALPPLTEANCSALPAAVEVSAIGETPSPSRSARSQSEKRRLRVDGATRKHEPRPGGPGRAGQGPFPTLYGASATPGTLRRPQDAGMPASES